MEILLVSGDYSTQEVGTALKTDQLLCLWSDDDHNDRKLKVSVAYNPYVPTLQGQIEENDKLLRKLSSGRVSKIYLRFGSNIRQLEKSIQWLERNCEPDIDVCGSIFLPMRQVLNRLKAKPLSGVYLDEKFLSNCTHAKDLILETMRLLNHKGYEMVIQHPGVTNFTLGKYAFDELLSEL